MITALIIAGGVGKRMGQEIPKQFIMVEEKPIIIYTLESFQKHPLIDRILVVCKKGWEQTLDAYAKEYHIDKLKEHSNPEDTIVIHDGIRPLVDELVLSDVIVKCQEYGNAVTSLPYNEQIFVKETEETTRQYINRETLRRVSTPQAYKFEKLTWAYEKAFRENIGISESSYTNTMMVDLGETLYFALGSDKNIKLTTQDDLQLFKGFLKMKEE